jgi:hypothetical protein
MSAATLSPPAAVRRGGAVIDHNLAVALRLASAGLHVFPCDPSTEKPRSKRPLVDNWPERATTDPNGVRYYWSTRPGAIIGLQLGRAGLVVVDLDQHGGPDGVAEFDQILDYYGGNLDGVPIVRTWSGGYHCYYRQPMGRAPLGNREGMLAGCGINIRGAGGYTIGPDSVMATGEFYECVEGWPDLIEAFAAGAIPEIPGYLVEAIEWRAPSDERGPSSLLPAGDVDPDRARKWGEGALRRIASALAVARKGNRNNDLNSAVYTLAGKAGCGRLNEAEVHSAMLWACGINKLIVDDGLPAFEATFRSAWNAGIARPLPGPRDRDANDGVVIDLKRKGGDHARVVIQIHEQP